MSQQPILRDQDLQHALTEQGFAVVTLYTPEEAAAIRAVIADYIPAEPSINDPQDGMYNSTFDQDLKTRIPEQVEAQLLLRLESMMLGYRGIGACVLAKVANAERLRIHQHQPVTPDIFTQVMLCWLTLDDVDADSGALRLVPRSQMILRHIQSFTSPPFFADFERELESELAEFVPMRAGQAILMDWSMLHGSCPNHRDRPALRISATLVPEEQPFCILAESPGNVFDAYAIDGKTVDPELLCMCGGSLEGLEPKGRLDNRNTTLTRSEFESLLRLNQRIAPGYDPIDAVRAGIAAASSNPATAWIRALGKTFRRNKETAHSA